MAGGNKCKISTQYLKIMPAITKKTTGTWDVNKDNASYEHSLLLTAELQHYRTAGQISIID